MKVVTIRHIDMESGYTVPVDQVDVFETDLLEELKESGADEAGYTEEEIASFLATLKDTKIGDRIDFGEIWLFTCTAMAEKQYNSLPEFMRW